MTTTNKVKMQNVAIVLVETPTTDEEIELYEIERLVDTAGGKVALTVTQKRNSVDPTTVLGEGKLQELKNQTELLEIDLVVFCNNLSSVQRRNASKTLDKFVIDKTDLILDIFALHANSAEGKKQVELAQLTYSLATRSEENFSRQGGGIGTRGPGETQLETDKRITREKITRLKKELKELEARKEVTRQPRKENSVFTVALVGYTNAGKSTLFNLLTGSDIYADDKLFATLDTTVRKCKLDCGIEIVFCDTVGFIRDLPHQLINAFKSTLDETLNADLILNVCDVSDPSVNGQIVVTENILGELGVTAPLIRVYNKCDKDRVELSDTCANCVFVSAVANKNIDVLLDMITDSVMKQYANITLKVRFDELAKLQGKLAKYTVKYSTDYDDDYANVKVLVRRCYLNLFIDYIV